METSSSSHNGNRQGAEGQGTLGTFGGVFTPSILTILGIILFLRMGFMVGSAGLSRALFIIAIANAVSILTSMSMSAAATNIHVKTGGAYYLISRSLGVHFGGAIGLVLFLAQSVSIAFYCIGFGEALSAVLPAALPISVRMISVLAILFLFGMAWIGADWATKFQYLVMGLLLASLLCFFIGAGLQFEFEQVAENWMPPEHGLPFWALFALFFPAVTGFTQGVNMSGDLTNPGKSIPSGTFWAVGVSAIIYFVAAVLFSGAMTNVALTADYDAMKRVAIVPQLITGGVLAATLSSAMASFLGAPRILQSLAADKIISALNPFSKGYGKDNNPRRGIILSGLIALVTVLLGHLNLVAQIVSMFFLISYALLNYATFYESKTNSPFFRPRFKYFRPWMSLAGFVVCTATIFAIDITAGIVAFSIMLAVYQYLKQYSGPPRFSDSRRSYFLQKAQENIRAAAGETEHDRDWRPAILALTKESKRLHQIMGFAGWLEGKAGITSAVRIITGQGLKATAERQAAINQLTAELQEQQSKAFPLVLSATDISEALSMLVQAYGLGPIKANTLLINWIDDMGKGLSGVGAVEYARNLKIVFQQGLNVLILDTDLHKWDKLMTTLESGSEHTSIDVWWEKNATGDFMLLVAYLITRNELFKNVRIRLIQQGPTHKESEISDELKTYLQDVRIDAQPVIVPHIDHDTIIELSSRSSIVFMPFRTKNFQFSDVSGGSLYRLLPQLGLTVLAKAAQDIDLEAEPDSGYLGDLAAASDAVEAARVAYKEATKKAEKLKAIADSLTIRLAELDGQDEGVADLVAESDQAISAYEAAYRKALKARVKLGSAVRELEQLAEADS